MLTSTALAFAVFLFYFHGCSCRITLISTGMTLLDASTCSGIVWTLQHEDGVQAILQPVVQYQAVEWCLSQVSVCFCTRLYSPVSRVCKQVQAVPSWLKYQLECLCDFRCSCQSGESF